MSQQEPDLESLREQIDQLDQSLLALVNQRATLAKQVADVKMKTLAPGEKPVFYRPEREAQVLRRIKERNGRIGTHA